MELENRARILKIMKLLGITTFQGVTALLRVTRPRVIMRLRRTTRLPAMMDFPERTRIKVNLQVEMKGSEHGQLSKILNERQVGSAYHRGPVRSALPLGLNHPGFHQCRKVSWVLTIRLLITALVQSLQKPCWTRILLQRKTYQMMNSHTPTLQDCFLRS